MSSQAAPASTAGAPAASAAPAASTAPAGGFDIKAQFNDVIRKIDAELTKYPIFKSLEEKAGVPKAYLFLGAASALLMILVVMVGTKFVSNLVGFLYPMYASVLALRTAEKADDTQWLTYWVVFGVFQVGETLLDATFWWLPIYWLAKFALLLWAMAPQTRGADLLYKKAVEPLIMKIESSVGGRTA